MYAGTDDCVLLLSELPAAHNVRRQFSCVMPRLPDACYPSRRRQLNSDPSGEHSLHFCCCSGRNFIQPGSAACVLCIPYK